MFANIYLNEVDQYIKNKLRIKFYVRYLDDSIIIVKTKKEAKQVLEKIKLFLKENLRLELNTKTQIFKKNEYRMKIRDRGKRKLKLKIRFLKKEIKNGNLTSKDAKKYLAGHMGYLKIANVNNLLGTLFYKEE